jgi:hypothetical protein
MDDCKWAYETQSYDNMRNNDKKRNDRAPDQKETPPPTAHNPPNPTQHAFTISHERHMK